MKTKKLLIIAIVALLLIATIISINILSFYDLERVVIEQLKDNQLTETEYAANQIEDHILQVRDELITLSKFPEINSLDINKCSGDMTIVHENIEGKISNLLRADKDGTIIECSSPDFSSYVGLNIKNKKYFQVPKKTNEPYIDTSLRQGSIQEVIVSAPLFETTEYTPYPNFFGEFKGILMSIIQVTNLYNLYVHPIVDPSTSMYLLINSKTGETMLKSNKLPDYNSIEEEFANNDQKLNVISDFNGFGKSIITSSKIRVGTEEWELIIMTPLANVGSQISNVQIRHLITLVFVIVILGGGIYLYIQLYQSKEEIESKLKKTNITLEKMGINIEVEEQKYNQADISLEPGKIYLVKEDKENHAHELFISTLNRGFAGLGIVRDDPSSFKKKYNLQKTSFIWMSEADSKEFASETNIDNLYKLIVEFIDKSKKSVILIDRFDYLISQNKSKNIMKTVHSLRDMALSNECVIILSLNPDIVSDSELKSIQAESIDLYGKHLKENIDLQEMELEMLKFINERNINNKLVSYKDITNKFDITKPTTRSKIKNLQSLGLLNVEQKGRYKTLKITSSGRKILNF